MSIISGMTVMNSGFHNRVKEGINNVFTQSVPVSADKGLISLDVELTPSMPSGIVNELKEVMEHQPATQDKGQKKARPDERRGDHGYPHPVPSGRLPLLQA